MKAMHNEQIQLFIHPLCAKYLNQRDSGFDDLTGLSEDELKEFKELLKKNKTKSHRACNSATMDLLYDFVVHVLAHKPIPGLTIKQETYNHKVVLVPPPDDIIEEEYVEEIERHVDGTTKIE
jgi:hypothetical protein